MIEMLCSALAAHNGRLTMEEKTWRVSYENTTYRDGDGGSTFEEWWAATDGVRAFRAEHKDDAEMLVSALNSSGERDELLRVLQNNLKYPAGEYSTTPGFDAAWKEAEAAVDRAVGDA